MRLDIRERNIKQMYVQIKKIRRKDSMLFSNVKNIS